MGDHAAVRFSGAVAAVATGLAVVAWVGWAEAAWPSFVTVLILAAGWGLLGVSVGAGLVVAARRPVVLWWVAPAVLVWGVALAAAAWVAVAADALPPGVGGGPADGCGPGGGR